MALASGNLACNESITCWGVSCFVIFFVPLTLSNCSWAAVTKCAVTSKTDRRYFIITIDYLLTANAFAWLVITWQISSWTSNKFELVIFRSNIFDHTCWHDRQSMICIFTLIFCFKY